MDLIHTYLPFSYSCQIQSQITEVGIYENLGSLPSALANLWVGHVTDSRIRSAIQTLGFQHHQIMIQHGWRTSQQWLLPLCDP